MFVRKTIINQRSSQTEGYCSRSTQYLNSSLSASKNTCSARLAVGKTKNTSVLHGTRFYLMVCSAYEKFDRCRRTVFENILKQKAIFRARMDDSHYKRILRLQFSKIAKL